MQTIRGFPLPLGFELFWASSHRIELIMVPGRLDAFELRSLDGLVVWREQNTPALILRGRACARSSIRDGRHVLELVSQGKRGDRFDLVIPAVEVLGMAVMEEAAAQACRRVIDLWRATRMAH